MLHWQLWTLKSRVYPKNVQGLIRGKNHADSHQPAWLCRPPTKMPLTLPWEIITWSPHPFSSGLLCKGRQVMGQLLVLVFGTWHLPNERGTEKTKLLLSIFHFRTISRSSGSGNIALVTTGDSHVKQAGGQRMGRPLLTLSYVYQLWYDTSVTLRVLTYSQVAQLLLRAFREISGMPLERTIALFWSEKAENINWPLRVKSKYNSKLSDYQISSFQKVESTAFPHHCVYPVSLVSETGGDSLKVKKMCFY